MHSLSIGALVLAGGRARRMGGQNKALLMLEGSSFLERLERAFIGFDELLLSANDASLAEGTRFIPVKDQFPDNGLLGVASKQPVALITDLPLAGQGRPVFGLNDYDAIVDFIIKFFRGKTMINNRS